MESNPIPVKKKNIGINFNRMDFLKDLLRYTNTTYADAARILGKSQPNISHLLSSSSMDMRLSEVQKLVTALGFKINLSLTRESDEINTNSPLTLDDLIVNSNRTLLVKPLLFFEFAMKRYGWTRKSLAEAMGIGATTVSYWLSEQDILMSRLLEAARTMDACLRMDITREIDTAVFEDSQSPFYVVHFSDNKTYK